MTSEKSVTSVAKSVSLWRLAAVSAMKTMQPTMQPTRGASFCNLVAFPCTDHDYATNVSKRLMFCDITKHMYTKHSAKFGVSS